MKGSKIFIVTMAFFTLLWGFSSAVGAQKENMTKQEEIAQIDAEIKRLEDMKRGYEARALRHDDHAIQLQFNQDRTLEVRRHLELAEENRQKAAVVQKEIDRLKLKRQSLLQ